MSGWHFIVAFTIPGKAASKANSRRSVPRADGGGNRFIKSKSAMTFERACATFIPRLPQKLDAQGMEVWVRCTLTYDSLRSDLDASIVFDQMQGRIFHDDVCITRMTIARGYEGDPRADVEIFAREWLIDGKPPKLRVMEPLRRQRLAEKLRLKVAAPPKRRSRKAPHGSTTPRP